MTAADQQSVIATLVDWYAAITRHDLQAVAEALSTDFLIVENDHILDAAELLAMLSAGISQGHQTAELSDFDIVIAGDIAWCTHRNDEIWYPNEGEPTPLAFLETVILLRHESAWLIERYHASAIEPLSLDPA